MAIADYLDEVASSAQNNTTDPGDGDGGDGDGDGGDGDGEGGGDDGEGGEEPEEVQAAGSGSNTAQIGDEGGKGLRT